MLADVADFLAPLLRRLDRMTMGASIECRNPFLDHRLVHKAINLPLEFKIGRRADKWVIKQVARHYLPEALVSRKKTGFTLPVGEYVAPLARPEFFEDGFCEDILGFNARGVETLMQSGARSEHAIFGLITLEIWGRLYFLGQTVADVEDLIAECESRAAAAKCRSSGGSSVAPALDSRGPHSTGVTDALIAKTRECECAYSPGDRIDSSPRHFV